MSDWGIGRTIEQDQIRVCAPSGRMPINEIGKESVVLNRSETQNAAIRTVLIVRLIAQTTLIQRLTLLGRARKTPPPPFPG